MLSLSRKEGQAWREAAAEQGRRFGLEDEVLADYDRFTATGDSPEEAAWSACCEWDVLDFTDPQS